MVLLQFMRGNFTVEIHRTCVRCGLTFIQPMHRSKPNTFHLLTYILTYILTLILAVQMDVQVRNSAVCVVVWYQLILPIYVRVTQGSFRVCAQSMRDDVTM